MLRYYAGKDSLEKDLSFLSIEQALADYAALIYHLKEKHKAEGSPVIAFGGSYGGMLAAWLRAKYPNAVQVTHPTSGYMKLLFMWASMTVCEEIISLKAAQDQMRWLASNHVVKDGLFVQGSIAASAPVRAFASRLNPSFIPSAFWEVRLSRCKSVSGQAGMG